MDPLSIITSTITLIQTISSTYEAIQDIKGLPNEFAEVSRKIPLAQATLALASKQLQPPGPDEASKNALRPVVSDCQQKAQMLQDIFAKVDKDVKDAKSGSVLDFYRSSLLCLGNLGKGNRVEKLMQGILTDLNVLATNQLFRAATQSQMIELKGAIEQLSNVESSVPDSDFESSGTNYLNVASGGTGYQSNITGQDHKINSGSGEQYNVSGTGHTMNFDYKHAGDNQYHVSGQAFFAPIQNYYQAHVMAEVKQTPLHECLRSLYFTGMNDRTDDIDNEAEGTCSWLLQHPVYMAWVSCTTGTICVKGKPGSGKSTLLRFALEKGKAALDLGEAAVFLSFFFHRRGVELQRTPAGLFQSLLYQLLKQAPDTLSEIVAEFKERCEERGKHGEKWWWHPRDLRRFFLSSLPKVLETRQVVLFVDALDECEQHSAGELAADLTSLSQRFPNLQPFRACFTCRHFPQVLTLDSESTILLDNENTDDIETYVQASLPAYYCTPEIVSFIVQHAQGVFMWARLALKKVQPLLRQMASPAQIMNEIDRPQDFNYLYGEIARLTSSPSETRELMECICFSMRPLTTDELRWALAVDPNRRPVTFLDVCKRSADFISTDVIETDMVEKRIKSLSCGLAEVVTLGKSRIVQFIHPSVKDFLLAGGLRALENTTKAPDSAAAAAHSRLCRICICYLQMVLGPQPKARSKRDKSTFPLLHYAITSWTAHAELGDGHETFPSDLLDLLGRPPERFINKWVKIYQRVEPLASDCPSTGSTLLHVASKNGLKSLLSRLLPNMNEKSINARDQDRQTPLSLAAKYGRTAAVELLLNTGKADIMVRDELGRTSLSRAAEEGHVDVAQLLRIGDEAVINAGDNYNQTPLSLATGNGHTAVTELLLGTDGIEVDTRDVVYGQTPLSLAARNGHEAVVKLLLDTSNADVNAGDKAGRTSLLQAAEKGHATVVEVILKTDDISVDARDAVYEQTPLQCAAQNGHAQVIELLLRTNKVDVDAKDGIGRTSLSRAAEAGHSSIVKLLLDTGNADISERDNEGQTPLDWAVSNQHETIAELLSSPNVAGDKTMMIEEEVEEEDASTDDDLAPDDGSPGLVASQEVMEPLQTAPGTEEAESEGHAISPTVMVKGMPMPSAKS